MHHRFLAAVALVMTLAGCAGPQPTNPSFDLSVDKAQAALDRMADDPVELKRPVVVINGWMDPGLMSMSVMPTLKRATGDDRVIAVSYMGASRYEACRRRLIDAVQNAFPRDDDVDDGVHWTRRVDVVAYSMGGIVARYAALPVERRVALAADESARSAVRADRRRLRIARLFTISTPHRGATMAGWAPWDQLARQLDGDAALIEQLDAALPHARFELLPYVRLDDAVVGPANAAPPARSPWWVANRPLSGGHMGAH